MHIIFKNILFRWLCRFAWRATFKKICIQGAYNNLFILQQQARFEPQKMECHFWRNSSFTFTTRGTKNDGNLCQEGGENKALVDSSDRLIKSHEYFTCALLIVGENHRR